MRNNCKESPKMEQFDAQYKHPFTCIIAGRSRAGKTTFVENLMLNKNKLIDIEFDYVLIFMGTSASDNRLSELRGKISCQVEIFETNTMFPGAEFCKQFPAFLTECIRKGKKGCFIFDDLMSELADCNILTNLFTKYSSHSDISVIFITQNLFFEGKKKSQNITIYRNTHILVLYRNPMDNSTISLVAKRISTSRHRELKEMFQFIQEKYRYVVIHGDFNTPEKLRFTTDVFSQDPVPNKKVFQLTNLEQEKGS